MDKEGFTEISEYFEQIGLVENKSTSTKLFVRLLEPLRDEIEQLAKRETEQAVKARERGEEFSLKWTAVHIRLAIELEEERRRAEANTHDEFYFNTENREYDSVILDGEKYDVNYLINLFYDLANTDAAGNHLLIPRSLQPFVEKHELANQVARGSWYAPNSKKVEEFANKLEEAYCAWTEEVERTSNVFDWSVSDE